MRARRAEGRAHRVVGDEVEVALAVARFDVGEAVPLLRQRAQRLGEHAELLRLDGELVGLGAERHADDADDVAHIGLLEAREAVLADRVALHVGLHAAVAVEQVEKRRLAEVALGHHPAGDGDRRLAAARRELLGGQVAELARAPRRWCGWGGSRSRRDSRPPRATPPA